jgi:hypothetical protein
VAHEEWLQIPFTKANIDLTLAMARKLGVLTSKLESDMLGVREKYVQLGKHGDYRRSDAPTSLTKDRGS